MSPPQAASPQAQTNVQPGSSICSPYLRPPPQHCPVDLGWTCHYFIKTPQKGPRRKISPGDSDGVWNHCPKQMHSPNPFSFLLILLGQSHQSPNRLEYCPNTMRQKPQPFFIPGLPGPRGHASVPEGHSVTLHVGLK